MHVDVGLVARIPERQPRQEPVLIAVVGDVLGGLAVGVEDRETAEPPVHLAHEFLGILQRHPLRGVVAFEVESQEIVRRRLGEIDEIVGLLERIAGPGKMIGAPFHAERLGHDLARLEQLARHRKAFPQRLAEFDLVSSP